jgi:trehalose-phosphatase
MPIYIGDDVTDEDAFRVVQDRGLALVVRGEDDGRPSLAHYALEDPADVEDFLAHIAERRRSWRSA